jgi:hypothetical protein
MGFLAIGVQNPLDAMVRGPQHPDPGERVFPFRSHDRRLYGGRPVGDAAGRVSERGEAGNGVVEAGGPPQCRQPSLSTPVLKPFGIRG